ncbi:MAG TPA: YfiR family protein [Sphingomonas sp.]|nr:YfiR family protein [Sphingomonas sp.]
MALLSMRARRLRAALLLITLSLIGTAAEAVQASLEWAVKASYLTKFAPFVEWPGGSFPKPDSPFRICVAGENPFDGVLTEVARGQQVQGHPIAIVHMATADADGVSACQILFVGKPAGQSAADILKAASGAPVLTVTDSSHGVNGGMIRFVMQGGRVRFAIDAAAAQASGLQISSKLLGLALKVER